VSFAFRDNVERMAGYLPGYQPTDRCAVKINTNENPYPPSPRVLEALRQLDGESLRRYPPVLWDDFRRVAADLHGVEPEMIIAGNGGDELLAMLVRCCCDVDRPLAYAVPTYSLYPVLAAIESAPVIEVPFEDERCGIPAGLYQANAALTILCNPNAPTGTLIPREEVAELAGAVEGVLAVDEAYVDFAETDCLDLVRQCENVIVLRSMSKGYSLAGMRFGYGVGQRRIIEAMIKVKDSYNVNIATQVAATAALADQAYFRENRERIVQERQRLHIALGKLGFEVQESHTNFLWARIGGRGAGEVYDALCQRNIYVRYFDQPNLKDHLRISIGTVEQNNALLDGLQAILERSLES